MKPSKQLQARDNKVSTKNASYVDINKSRSSTPDHQELIEHEKMRFSIRADVADENDDYSNFGDCQERQSISDINILHKEFYKEEKSKNFPEFSKQFFAKNDKDALEKQKNDMKYQENALKFRE